VLVAQYGVFALPLVLVASLLSPLLSPRGRGIFLAGCLAAAVAAGLGLVLERTLDRPRPFVALAFAPLFAHAADSSFPSDHTLVGVALVGPLLWRRPRLGVVSVGWACLVGMARVAAGVHYPSDIVGSAALGLLLSLLGLAAAQRLLPVGIGKGGMTRR